MSQIQQGRAAGHPAVRARSRLGSVSRRAVEYFVDPGPPGEAEPEVEQRDQDTAEFTADVPAPPVAATVLPLTRSGAYEREPVDRRLAELERQLVVARAVAATPRGAEAEIQYLGEETAEIIRVAHQKAEALVARAVAEADAVRAAARAQAEEITRAAESRRRELDGDTELIWAERTRLLDDTVRLAEALRAMAESAAERFPPAAEEPAAGPCLEEPRAPSDLAI
jgi:hypothetical protein